jgi:DNA-binding HxlR family transcriptional regulator
MTEYDYQQLDEVIHSRIRLAIMAVLVSVAEADFVFLRENVNTTDGNLSIHLKKLEEVGYISSKKEFVERKPISTYQITQKGRQAFEMYIEHLERMLGR